jgi:hypothetical protein
VEPRFYINLPMPLAAALDLAAGEEMQWQLLDRSDLRLRRLAAPRPFPDTQAIGRTRGEGFSAESISAYLDVATAGRQ